MDNGGPQLLYEFGTDTSADEVNNPTDCKNWAWSTSKTSYSRSIILCVGDITWEFTSGGYAGYTYRNIDFYTHYLIPDMTAADLLENERTLE
ncbi:unnamed protein product, partial [marine sediment metagenome]